MNMSSSSRFVDLSRVRAVEFRTLSGRLSQIRIEAKGEAGEEKRDLNEIEREGFQKGFDSGERSGFKMAEQKIEAMLKRFSRSLEELALLRKHIVKETERDLVELSLEIARRLVHREIQIDEKIIVTLVRVALEKLNAAGKITILVNPLDQAVVEQQLDALVSERGGSELIVKATPELNRGDCVIESDSGRIDARISEQFKEVENGLLNGF